MTVVILSAVAAVSTIDMIILCTTVGAKQFIKLQKTIAEPHPIGAEKRGTVRYRK